MERFLVLWIVLQEKVRSCRPSLLVLIRVGCLYGVVCWCAARRCEERAILKEKKYQKSYHIAWMGY